MLTNNDTAPVAYLVTYYRGKTNVVRDYPAASETGIRSIEPLYRKIGRRGFNDIQLIEFCDAVDAEKEVQDYLVVAARRVMGELQKLNKDRELRKPTLPACLRKKVNVPEYAT